MCIKAQKDVGGFEDGYILVVLKPKTEYQDRDRSSTSAQYDSQEEMEQTSEATASGTI